MSCIIVLAHGKGEPSDKLWSRGLWEEDFRCGRVGTRKADCRDCEGVRSASGDRGVIPQGGAVKKWLSRKAAQRDHPWIYGQIERMSPTVKEARVQRYQYDSHN